MNLVETINDHWWQAQERRIRSVRTMDDDFRKGAVQRLIDTGVIPADQVSDYLEILWYKWNPVDVVGEAAILMMSLAKDMIATGDKPFGLSNRPGDGGVRGAIGTSYNLLVPADRYEIGSAWEGPIPEPIPGNGTFEKLLTYAQGGSDAPYYADWSLLGMIPVWCRIA